MILDENDVIVPEHRILRAIENVKIKKYLSHSKLKRVIRDIDGARHKKKQLWKRTQNDRDFRVFVDELLMAMGYMNQEGQFEVPKEYQKP